MFWGDERYVPHSDAHSNYRMGRTLLLDHVPCPAENVHPMPTHLSAADAGADRPVPVTILAVTKTPMSGSGEELSDFAGISAAAIVRTVQGLATTEDAGAAAAGRHSSGHEGISARMKER